MIKAKYTLGDKSTTIEFETIEQLLKYERAQKDESYQSLPESFDKDAFHKKVDEIKASRLAAERVYEKRPPHYIL